FHSIAAQILRRHAELVGLKANYTIIDVDDQERLIRQLLAAESIDPKRWTPRHLAGLIDQWKNRGWTPEKLPAAEGAHFANNRGQQLYQMYQERLRILNACDFGDLLLHNLTIFQANADVLQSYQRRFRYILVDEYQDTNVSQYLWLRLLAQAHRNLCCVGDDDQSIYGWRGAEVDNILRFERDFPGAQVVRLERNYRSTEHILAAASGLIAANQDRLGKTLWTDTQGGQKVQVRGVWDGEAESRLVAEEIERWVRARRYSEVAVLVRASFQMRAFEERFVLLQIPYSVVGGPRFFERAEIRDAHAYLRLVQSADDDLAFERIVNTPKRGLGDTTIQKLLSLARARAMPATAAAHELVRSDELPARTRTALSNFLRDIERWRGQAGAVAHPRLAETILEESGYIDALRLDKTPTSQSRLENLKELVQSMGAFESLSAYLEHVSLVSDLDRNAGADAVQIMTLHSAKGLEFPLVFLPGWEEGVFPSQRSMDENGTRGLEEERRLAYVGLTRAREEARISFAANRQVYGRWTSQLPSRFVDELPLPHVEAASETGYYGGGPGLGETTRSRWDEPNYGAGYDSPGWRRAQARGYAGGPPGRTQVIEGEGRLVAVNETASAFAKGDRVFHQKFGYGLVRGVEGNKLTVAFETAGEKRVIDSFVALA
ncbi:MAG TPA: 3'-5' exonuclease, partial [Caulobacteraceae bacterium]|nr:3'-5' exonuclease [Caulobacteraceae bacterium]